MWNTNAQLFPCDKLFLEQWHAWLWMTWLTKTFLQHFCCSCLKFFPLINFSIIASGNSKSRSCLATMNKFLLWRWGNPKSSNWYCSLVYKPNFRHIILSLRAVPFKNVHMDAGVQSVDWLKSAKNCWSFPYICFFYIWDHFSQKLFTPPTSMHYVGYPDLISIF